MMISGITKTSPNMLGRHRKLFLGSENEAKNKRYIPPRRLVKGHRRRDIYEN